MQAITRYLAAQGYSTVEDSFYTAIEGWRKWYRGHVPAFHNYTQYNGKSRVRRHRKSLGMAKKIAEDWASLLMNEKVEITISDTAANDRVQEVFDANDFRVRANQIVEIAFALGTGAFVEYMDGDEIQIDYIRAGMIYPLSWENGRITECAFASERKRGKDIFVYLNIHKLDASGNYVIENAMFKRTGNILSAAELPEDVAPEFMTRSPIPRFQIITPNIVNNIDLDCPMGVSVYANAVDQIEHADSVFDSYFNEFRLGKKRIMIPMSLARIMMEKDGDGTIPVFDDNDVEFYVLQTGENIKDQKTEEMNGVLRFEAHESGLSSAVNLCGYKCGFGENHYKFKDGAVKTAKEVISANSAMYRSMRKHEIILQGAIEGLVAAIADMLGIRSDYDVAIAFDDSIIQDADSERAQDLQDVRDGIMTKVEYRMKWYGETEKDARAKVAEIEGSESDDDIMGFGNKSGEGGEM